MSSTKVHGIDTGCWKPVQCLKEFKTEENEILYKVEIKCRKDVTSTISKLTSPIYLERWKWKRSLIYKNT